MPLTVSCGLASEAGKLQASSAEVICLGYDIANAAQSTAENTAETNRQALITALSQDPTAGHTVIDGGYIKTALIEVESILAKNITLRAEGYIQSSNYAENAAAYPTAGFKLDAANNVIKAYNSNINGGTF